MSPTSAAPLWLSLLLYLMDQAIANVFPTNMRMKCGDAFIPGSFETTAGAIVGSKYQAWTGDICSPEPKDPSYLVCNQCNTDCLMNITGRHVIVSKNPRIPGVKTLWFTYENSGSGILGTCTLIDEAIDGGSGTDALRSFSKTSVLFVSISFIILMVISLAWLVFYYVQRFRYAHAKDRLQRRLFNAARKALTKIHTRTLRAGESILDTDCAVCIDPYQIADVVRELPCKHVYHKSCIDPWLLEHRTCPMCKADIVKHFGFHLTGTEGNRLEEGGARDAESPEPPSSGSESAAFPYQGGPADLEFHYAPTTSPQLVMSSSTAKSFAIVPLTVHSKTLPVSVNTPADVEQAGPSNRTERIVSVGQIDGSAVRHSSARTASQGQVVNLIQVRARAQSCTRAVPLRRAERPGSTRPAPIDTNHVV